MGCNENQPFPFNNLIYKVALSSPASSTQFPEATRQPCTVSPPAKGVSTIIVRLGNPRALGLNNTNRIENEVAEMHLSRAVMAQLGPTYAGIVPAVNAWKAAAGPDPIDETEFGRVVMEYLTGSSLHAAFNFF